MFPAPTHMTDKCGHTEAGTEFDNKLLEIYVLSIKCVGAGKHTT